MSNGLISKATHIWASRTLLRYAMGPSLSPRASRLMAGHLQSCPSCRNEYDQLQFSLSKVTGRPPQTSTSWQRDALFANIMDTVEALPNGLNEAPVSPAATHSGPAIPWWRLASMGGAAAALIAFIAIQLSAPTPGDQSLDELVNIRGAQQTLPEAALGLSGVDQQGFEYEVAESQGLCPQDAMRIYARVRNPDYRFARVFALQEHSLEPTWYFPSAEEQTSYEVPDFEGPWPFPFDIPVEGNHQAGPLALVALFTTEPISVHELQLEWSASAGLADSTHAMPRLQALLDRWEARGYHCQATLVRILEACPGGRP